MTDNQHGGLQVGQPVLDSLFVDWLIRLLDDRYGVRQRGSPGERRYSITLTDESVIEVEFDASGQPQVQGPTEHRADLPSLVEDARKRASALDFGSGVWWETSFSTDVSGITGVGMLHMMRTMSEHNTRRFQGDWRLGGDALLSFEQAETGPAVAVFPKFDVHMTFRVPAPAPGPHAEAIAAELGTFVRAAVAFATGAPLLGSPVLFPADEDKVREVTSKLANAPELPVEGEPLWAQVWAQAPDVQSTEALRRVQGAMFAYEQAMLQGSEYVTIALLISALEALSVPNASWQQDRVTTRFFRFLKELCPEAIDEVMSHANFAQAFGAYTSKRRFMDAMYSLRSKPLHTGFLQHRLAVLPMADSNAQIRVALISDIVRAGIVEFLRRPFSSLVGHPRMSPTLD